MGHNFELIPFGSGRGIYPGITMGSTTVMVTLANLLYRFDWEVPNGMKREDISLEENVGVSISKKSPLTLYLLFMILKKVKVLKWGECKNTLPTELLSLRWFGLRRHPLAWNVFLSWMYLIKN